MTTILLRTALIYFFLSVLLKIMGKRQIGELDIGDLVSTLLISEVAALPIGDPDLPLLSALVPTLFILSAQILISYIKNSSAKLKSIVEGEPCYVIYRHKLYQHVLRENRISLNELLSQMRQGGIGDIRDIAYGVLEPNGNISLLTEGGQTHPYAHALIIDGEVREKSLCALGYDRGWLSARLHEPVREIFLFTVDDRGDTYIIRKEDKA